MRAGTEKSSPMTGPAIMTWLQPSACISVCGPDIRWCGNEAGHTRPSEWSVVPARLRDAEKVAAESQHTDDPAFRERKILSQDLDLGSRTALEGEKDLIWYPAEVNTSIRPGWFYHENEDDKVRGLDELLDIYYNSVGGNATFLLNIPPTKSGRFHENDVRRLKELGEYLDRTFSTNLLERASLTADRWKKGHEIEAVKNDDGGESFYQTDEGVRAATVTVRFPEQTSVSHVVLKENIRMSQRIEAFEIRNERGELLYRGTTVGYKKIARFADAPVKELQIRIPDSRICPTLSFVGVY